jgi:hypothetical protein
VEALRAAQRGAGGNSGGRALRPTPIVFALLALICFASTAFAGMGALVLVALGVMFTITAFYAWMIL